jgi:hypothetical protein
MVEARIPEIGEQVEFGKYATSYKGEQGEVVEIEDHGEVGGYRHVDVWVKTNIYEDGKRVLVACSPVELAGMVVE